MSPSFKSPDTVTRRPAFTDVSSRSRSESIASTRNITPDRAHGGAIPRRSPTPPSRAPSSPHLSARSTTDPAAARRANGSHDDERASAARVSAAADPFSEDQEAPPKKKRLVTRAPQPKLDIDMLRSESGLPDVFYKFPEEFRSKAQGPGHEVADLRTLLGMFSRWHRRLFKQVDFDTFVAKLEKLGSSSMVKNELRAMRANLLAVMEPDPEPVPERATPQPPAPPTGVHLSEATAGATIPATAPKASAAVAAAKGSSGARTEEEEEEDEILMQMMKQDYDEILDELETPAAAATAQHLGGASRSAAFASGSSKPGPSRGGSSSHDIDDLDDEELLALAHDQELLDELDREIDQSGAPTAAAAPSTKAANDGCGDFNVKGAAKAFPGDVDDDELIELALGLE